MLRQPSTHVPAAGSPTRKAAAAAIHEMLQSAPEYRVSVGVLAAIDILEEADFPQGPTQGGVGAQQVGQQDGGSALLGNQLIPAEVEDIEEHIEAARAMRHPAARGAHQAPDDSAHDSLLAAEVEAAVRHRVHFRGDGGREMRRRKGILARVAKSLEPLTRRIRETFSPQHIRCTPFEHPHIAFFAAVREALGKRDIDLPVRLALGAQIAGDLPPTGCWDSQSKPRPAGLDFDDLPHSQWNEWLHKDVRRRATASPEAVAAARAVFEKTRRELDKGLCDGPWTFEDVKGMYGKDTCRMIRRFGVTQNGDIRVCDNAAEHIGNDASNQWDKLRCQRADFAARVADRFSHHLGRDVRGWSLLHGTDDQASAYRRCATSAPGYSIVAVWNPDEGRVEYYTMFGFNFGWVSAVLYYCAIPNITAAACRRLLGVVTDHYFDDFDTIGLAEEGQRSQSMCGWLHNLVGFPFAPAKHSPAAPANKFKGVVVDFANLAQRGVVEVYVDEGRRRKVCRLINAALSERSLTPSQAASLAGKLQFTLSWAFGRVGKAAMQPIQVRASQEGEQTSYLNDALKRALRFLYTVVRALPRREIDVTRHARPPVLIWSDAMYERTGTVPARGGFLVHFPAEVGEDGRETPAETLWAEHITPEAVVRRFVPGKKQYIGQLELLYAVAPYTSIPGRLRGRQCIHFVDNTSAIAALVKGYARAIDSGLIVNAYHAFQVGLRTDVYFEYVRSKANIADLPSRAAASEMRGILKRLGWHGVRVDCVLPDISAWDAEAATWIDRAVAGPRRHSNARKRRRNQEDAQDTSDAPRPTRCARRASAWIRDVHEEGIEPHPGPPSSRSSSAMTRVAPSAVAGLGLFANVRIERMASIATIPAQRVLSKAEAPSAWAAWRARHRLPHDACIRLHDGRIAYGAQWRSSSEVPDWYRMNHSTTPNVIMRLSAEGVVWRARRDIEPGEELTYHYGEPDARWAAQPRTEKRPRHGDCEETL